MQPFLSLDAEAAVKLEIPPSCCKQIQPPPNVDSLVRVINLSLSGGGIRNSSGSRPVPSSLVRQLTLTIEIPTLQPKRILEKASTPSFALMQRS